ncbi:MAG TPA: MaoC/PaaZ C-terminal domain-containing protein [Polyangiales bacterium]|nr:MaoC/PaaZ C-terminal domain-containing protein [Polyangiales bacterium]
MPVSNRHILEQGPALTALGRVALTTLEQQLLGKKPSKKAPQLPGKKIEVTLPPRSAALIDDFVSNVGGDPSAYRGTLPPSFFPQWGFASASRAMEGVPYPMSKVLNAGSNFTVHAPIPAGESLNVSAQLVNIDDDGRRAILTTRVITSTKSVKDALVADMITLIPLKRDKSEKSSAKKEQPSVPVDAEELTQFEVGPWAGLDFAKLTGDFNPIHWIPPAARASGFKNVILHGFGTMARTIEGLNQTVLGGDPLKLKKWSCRFTKPLVLPAKASLFVRGNEVYVGIAAGGPAYLVGEYGT